MFIGRERELQTLNQCYHSNHFEFVVVYGRRRVGKTALIHQFIQGLDAIYFMGIESNARQNLYNFSKSILESLASSPQEAVFPSFQSALEYVFLQSQNKRLVLTIDEYPYVARCDQSFASTLQLLIDKYKDDSKLMLIVCGSAMSYMQNHVLAYQSPLYGRRTAQMKILPFDFSDTCRYYKHFSYEDLALFYGLTGGTPQYMLQMDDTRSIEDNIKNTFLNPSSPLFEEPENLLKQEVREPATYNAIITAIADGASRLSEIAGKVGENTNVCTAYINNLLGLGLVQKEHPYGEKTTKKTIYSIEDGMFRFWYRFVPKNYAAINMGATDLVYQRIVPHLSDYMGKVFEDICKQYLWKLLMTGQSPIAFTDLGRWWGTNPLSRKQEEIDIMGEEDKDTALFAECKWTNEKVDLDILETLVSRSRLFPYHKVHFFLFAKRGFTTGCVDRGNHMKNVTLVSYQEMVLKLENTTCNISL
jgi:AAA+ ATPase superfamily predicted ATPase